MEAGGRKKRHEISTSNYTSKKEACFRENRLLFLLTNKIWKKYMYIHIFAL